MRENVGQRGWDRLFRGLQVFVPRVGPALPAPSESTENKLPKMPEVKSAGFDTQIQKEGLSVTLRRLDAPAAIAVEYQGKTYSAAVEAIAYLVAFFVGIRLLGWSRQSRFAYFIVVGLGALIVAGAVNPRSAGIWKAIYLGVLFSALVWLGLSLWKWLVAAWRWLSRLAQHDAAPQIPRVVKATPRPPAPPSPPPSAPPTGGPAQGPANAS